MNWLNFKNIILHLYSNQKMKKKNRIVFGIVLSIQVCSNLLAQHPDFLFEYPYPFTLPHMLFFEERVEVVHLEIAPNANTNSFYLVAASDDKNTLYYESDSVVFQPMIYKVSLEGEVLGNLVLGYEDQYSMVVRLFDDPYDVHCCLAIGVTHDNIRHYDRPFMAKFDHDLNLLWQREMELPEPYHEHLMMAAIMDNSGNIVCLLAINGIGVVFCRITADGEIVTISQYAGPCIPYIINCGNMFEFQDGSGDYGIIMENATNIGQGVCYCIRINSDLEMKGYTIFPLTIHENNSSFYYDISLSIGFIYLGVPLLDGSVLLGGMGNLTRMDFGQNYTCDNVVGFIRFDQEGNVISFGSAGQGEMGVGNDSLKMIQGKVCADLVGDDAFYSYYMEGKSHGTGYDWMNCFVVTKMDFVGNVIWQRYWDRYYPEYGMKVYYPNFLTTTSDDGCLISGYCYYSDIYGSNRFGSNPDIFMLKIFADGTLVTPELESFVRPYTYYPNPTQNELHLQYSPDVTPKQIELYDLQGRLVKTQRTGLESLNLQGLSAGTYTMRVTLEGGKVFTDKVVKE